MPVIGNKENNMDFWIGNKENNMEGQPLESVSVYKDLGLFTACDL